MRAARNKVVAFLLILLAGLAAAIVIAVLLPYGWIAVVAYTAGIAAGWLLFGTLVTYAQQRTKQRIAQQVQSGAIDVDKLAAALGGHIGRAATRPATDEGTVQ